MKRRHLLLGMAAAPLLTTTGYAQDGTLILPTNARQGDVLRGTAPTGATVQIGSLVPPFEVDASGDFIVGLSRNAPPNVQVTSTAIGDRPAGLLMLAVEQRNYLSVTISGTARTGANPESAAAPNSEFGLYRGLDLLDGGDPEIPQDASERSAVVAPSDEERETRAERIQREATAKREAFQSRLPLHGYLEEFQWPVRGRITSQWGAQRTIITRAGEQRPDRPHAGVDIRAITGTPVLAPASGVVVLAGADYFYEGGVVFVDHGQGLISIYLHMSAVDVRHGQTIERGQEIGRVGALGRATGPHLCWRMKWRGVDVDPTSLVAEAES